VPEAARIETAAASSAEAIPPIGAWNMGWTKSRLRSGSGMIGSPMEFNFWISA
jgi:hypothetical protein